MADQWILKPGSEHFEVMDGELAGRRFAPGRVYTEIPAAEKSRFKKWVPRVAKTSKAKSTRKKGAEGSK